MSDRDQFGDEHGRVDVKEARGILNDVLADLPGVVYRCRNDRDWTVLGFSKGVRELTGYAAEELIENDAIPYAELIHPDDRERIWDAVQDAVEAGTPFRFTYRIRTRSGTERWVLEQGRAVQEDGETILTGYIQDVTGPLGGRLGEQQEELERVRRERRYLELLQSVTAIVNEERLFEDALRAAIPEVCRTLDFEVGHVFLPADADGTRLRSSDIWHLNGDVDGLQCFRDATESGGWSVEEGLPGRVMRSGSAEWVQDVAKDPRFLRIDEASGTPVQSGIGVPLVSEDRTLGVLEFYSVETMAPTPDVQQILEQIGLQIGRVWERESADRSQRASEERFRQLAEHVEAVLALSDLQGNVLYLSPGFEALTGRDRVADTRELLELIHPDDRPRMRELFSDPDRAPYEVEHRIVRTDGEVRWIRQRGFPIRNDDGDVYRIGSLAEDVTEKRRDRERLKETTRFLEQTISSLAEAVLVIDTSGSGRGIVQANEAAERIFGYTREEMIGNTTEMLHVDRERFERFGKEGLPRLEEEGVFHADYPLKRKDGTVFEAEQRVSLLNSSEGLEGGAVSVVRDVSDRERAEAKLRESEERFRQIAEHIDDVFWISDPDEEELEYVSPAYRKIWDRPTEEVRRDPGTWMESIHPDDRERVRKKLSDPATESYEEEYRIVRPDGSIRWIWDRAFPVEDEDGNVVKTIGVAEDITERKELESQLLHAQKMEAVGRLAGGIAHDFNNILTVIRGQSDLLLQDLPPGSRVTEEVDVIRDAADRASRLTRQLLAFGREQVMQPRVDDLSEIVEEILPLLDRLLGEDIEIVKELADDLPAVRVDPGQIEQVVVNLAQNARDAMPEGGTLRLETGLVQVEPKETSSGSALEPGPHVRLTVSDTGVGMKAEVAERAFDPFFTTKERGKGTGLGLAVTHGIVKQSGGAIEVETEPGRGTSFTLRLPAVEGEREPRRRGRGPGMPSEIHSGRVLLIEDDASVRRLSERILTRSGFDAIVAENAEEGLRLLQEEDPPDLILTDLVLPEASGRVVVERARERVPGVPIVVMSGYARGTSDHRDMLPQDVGFVRKPFTTEILLKAIRHELERHRGDFSSTSGRAKGPEEGD